MLMRLRLTEQSESKSIAELILRERSESKDLIR
jgi:hypothetical protein